MRLLDRFACAAVVLALAAPAFGQSKADEARATELKKEGDKLVHDSKYREALEKYDASFALVANPAIQYNRARALQALGDFPGALDAFEKFDKTAPAALKSRVPHLDKMIADVAAHVATVAVRCEVPGAKVTLRGKEIGTTPMQSYRTTPGDATITVEAPGYVTFTEDTSLAEGQTTTVDAALKKAAAENTTEPAAREPTPFDVEKPTTTTPAPPVAEQPTSHGRSAWRTLAFVSGGIGIASLGVGLTFLGLSIGDKNAADPHCPGKVCDAIGHDKIDEAWTFADISTVLVVVGAVALATSLVSFIVTPKAAPVQAGFFLGPGSASLGGTF